MSTPHFLVFVGGSPSLSTELDTLKRRFKDLEVIAPGTSKHDRGISSKTAQVALSGLVSRLREIKSHNQPARLTVWAYGPNRPAEFEILWNHFGACAWIERIPPNLIHKDRLTRLHIQARMDVVVQSLHEISHQIYNRRKSSPLPLPLRNFKSDITRQLAEYWYVDSTPITLRQNVEKNDKRFKQFHAQHKDNRALLFKPANDSDCHGIPHPTGSNHRCFVDGRFRFGAALFPGFHYDVTTEKGLLDCIVVDCLGNKRDLKPEKREYINIFPNDHLLPER